MDHTTHNQSLVQCWHLHSVVHSLVAYDVASCMVPISTRITKLYTPLLPKVQVLPPSLPLSCSEPPAYHHTAFPYPSLIYITAAKYRYWTHDYTSLELVRSPTVGTCTVAILFHTYPGPLQVDYRLYKSGLVKCTHKYLVLAKWQMVNAQGGQIHRNYKYSTQTLGSKGEYTMHAVAL